MSCPDQMTILQWMVQVQLQVSGALCTPPTGEKRGQVTLQPTNFYKVNKILGVVAV